MALREEGLLQAGPDYVSIVGNGEQWCVGWHGGLAFFNFNFKHLQTPTTGQAARKN